MEDNEEISKLREELYNPEINKQRKRYLEDLLTNREKIKHSPSKYFERYCIENPWESECRIYDL
jgi:hypothetical protein